MTLPRYASIEEDGWTLESGEGRHALSPASVDTQNRPLMDS